MVVRNKVLFNVSDNTEPSVFLIAPEGLFSFEIHAVKESKTGRESKFSEGWNAWLGSEQQKGVPYWL